MSLPPSSFPETEKTRLLALIAASAHDMKQPLQAIELLGEMLKMPGKTAEELREINIYLQASLSALREITRLTGDLAKMINGQNAPEKERCCLHRFLLVREGVLAELMRDCGCSLLIEDDAEKDDLCWQGEYEICSAPRYLDFLVKGMILLAGTVVREGAAPLEMICGTGAHAGVTLNICVKTDAPAENFYKVASLVHDFPPVSVGKMGKENGQQAPLLQQEENEAFLPFASVIFSLKLLGLVAHLLQHELELREGKGQLTFALSF